MIDRRSALAAGFGLLAMVVLSGYSFATLSDAGADLRGATAGFAIVAVLDVVVAWGLYGVLAPADRGLAQLCAGLRVAYAAAFLAAQGNLLAGRSGVDAFERGWDLALLVFGVHLLVTGWAAIRAPHVPTWLGALLILAGAGYAGDSLGTIAGYDLGLATFTFVGEVVLLGWLLWAGYRAPRGVGNSPA
ncbi:DUF4386 domain-containing protein [Dactylosporangium sucinum]|uniref:DUF4386 domain-containing protein n=1 Tax=Dactylosporangium sucinum TaxID=1424081 RepID=A0A917UBY1_9ACTN|nr:DUF4386 domain-containing protein [Dactylosporangium sucinum]GGM77605.1 DUF4386 domain-containing protein [Dactylosporangium sucinum]GGM77615.1 DUF4386 domain-containing protein [Dactylosporangium sucinum]